MVAFLYALITGPVYGFLALLRSWIWIVGVMGAFAVMAEIGNPFVAIFILLVAIAFLILLGFSIARESLTSIHAEWAIHRDVTWLGAFIKYFGASLLAFLWSLLIGGVVVLFVVLGLLNLPEDVLRELPYYLAEKAQNPYGTVPGYENYDRALLIGIFAINVPAAVFTTTFVAAAAGNGLLSGNGWTIGRGTLRMAIAAFVYGWLSFLLLRQLTELSAGWAPEVAAGAMIVASWGLNWAMLMGCAAQVYVRRLEWDLGEEDRNAAATFDDEQRQETARAMRESWMSDQT